LVIAAWHGAIEREAVPESRQRLLAPPGGAQTQPQVVRQQRVLRCELTGATVGLQRGAQFAQVAQHQRMVRDPQRVGWLDRRQPLEHELPIGTLATAQRGVGQRQQ
jgi:hypothetical protein